MVVNYTYSRAAILCLGGWGLQTMLHLVPRLQTAQEQRTALEALGPDLNRTTSLAAVLPDPLLTGDNRSRFHLRRVRSTEGLQPYHVERLLSQLRRQPAPSSDEHTAALLTAAERRAVRLMGAADPILDPIGFDGYDFSAPGEGVTDLGRRGHPNKAVRRATRRDMFHCALVHADAVARLLETHLLDPVRQDNLAPDDPFVQTTLYVVAPLFEPLASALIWPLVGGIMARLGRRHISNVVALLATGSYALDLTRPFEDAAGRAALAELEVLAGLRREANAAERLTAQVRDADPLLAEHIGEALFDHIYLLDREKSNQGLAEDSHELAVLAGNALEALIVGNGDLYIQEQLGFTLHAGEQRPYSLIGAAADYVPLAQVFHAVSRQEESRLVRDWVLQSTHHPQPAPKHPFGRPAGGEPQNPSLVDLGFSLPRMLEQLAMRMPDLFVNTAPASLAEVAVKEEFIFPASTAAAMAGLDTQTWPDAFTAHMAAVRQTMDLAVGKRAVDEAWGMNIPNADVSMHFAAGLAADDRIFPQTLHRMHGRLVDLISASPTGLIRARSQTQSWLQQTKETLHRLEVASTPSTRQISQIRHESAAREWTAKYVRAANRRPSLRAIFLRAGLATGLVALLAWGYLFLVGRAWNPATDGLALSGFAAGIAIIGLVTFRMTQARQRRLRQVRVYLAQAEATDHMQAAIHDGLVRMVSRVTSILQTWHLMLQEAMEELHALSTPPEIPAVPPADVVQSYLYRPQLNEELWGRCLDYLRSHLETHGPRSEERLDTIWGQAKWRRQMQRILQMTPRHPERRDRQSQAQTIAEFIRQTVRESVAPVSIATTTPSDANSLRSDLIRALSGKFDIEHMLWRGAAEAQDIDRRLRAMSMDAPERQITTDAEILTNRRYVEAAWNRAKPTANYDVADRLAVYGVTIDFAAASGAVDSDLTRNLLEEFNVALLPTENPFTIIFVRTVHGLALEDLDCMRRYEQELRRLDANGRMLLLLDELTPTLYATALPTKTRGQQHHPQEETS